MICANFATFTVAGGTLAATGFVYSSPCAPMDSVVMTYGEYVAVVPQDKSTGSASPFILTMQEGSAIAAAIALVWAVAWGYKQLIKSVNGGNPE